MKRKFSPKLCGVACAAFLFIAAASAAVLLSGALRRETAPYTVLFPDEAGEYSILSTGSYAGCEVSVFTGDASSVLLRSDAHGVKTRVDLKLRLDWAALYGGSLFVRSGGDLIAYDPSTLRELSRRALPWPADELVRFACDQDGVLYGVLSQSRDTVRVVSPGGTEQTVSMPSEIEAFCGCPQGVLVWSGGSLRMLSGTNTRSDLWPCAPLAAFGSDCFLDCDGLFCVCGPEGVVPLFRCEQALYEGPYYCLDEEGCLLAAGETDVSRFDRDGALLGQCVLEAAPKAVSTGGAFFRKDGMYCFSPFSFLAQEGPKESAEPSASPAPTPSAEPPVRVENEYILLSPGTTVEELRELMKPEAVDVRSRTGSQLTAGALATGMTANGWVLVVEGDCNGSGDLTGSDLREAVSMSLAPEREMSPQFRAADLNGDGAIDASDLLALSELIEAHGN